MIDRLLRLLADDATFPYALMILCLAGSVVGAGLGAGVAWLADRTRWRGQMVDWEGQD